MSHPFHYFIPGQGMDSFAPGRKVSQTQLEAVGLGHLYGSVSRGVTLGEAKIDGRSGVLMTPNLGDQPAPITSYCPDSQTWISHGRIMIGWDTSCPPTAEVLAKKVQVFGYQLLAGGSQWVIPLARSPRGISNIPQDYRFGDDGKPAPQRRADYEWLWELSGEVWDYWHTERGIERGETWLVEQALRIMQVNYFIGQPEVNAFSVMGRPLLDQINIAAITLALIDNDFPKAVDDAKKNEQV